jgi:DNA repair photolyase
MQQSALFAESEIGGAPLPIVGQQKDISYYGAVAHSVLNGPETTGMGFWSVNPYVGCAFGCAYCYARYTHRWVLDRHARANPDNESLQTALTSMQPWLAFERRIFVKQNAADSLRKVLRHGSDRHLALINGDSIVIGTATDPYQPAERRFRVTRSVLEVLADHPGLSIVIISKSPLITRDIDLLKRIARHSSLSIHISLISTDRELARRIEPRAPTPEARLRALGRLRANGIWAGVNIMPVLPGITDGRDQLDRLVHAVAEQGAMYVNTCALRLRSSARQRYLPFIEREFPKLARRYRATYAFDHHVSAEYSAQLRAYVRELCEQYGVTYGRDRSVGPNEKARAIDLVEQLELGFD